MAVLIILTWVNGFGGGGPSAALQEFSSMDRCEAAASSVRDNAQAFDGSRQVRAFCVEK